MKPGGPPRLAAGKELIKGPWLQAPTQDGVTVMWETVTAQIGEVEWFATEPVHAGLSGGARTLEGTRRSARETDATRIHKVRVEGLQGERGYHYRIVGQDELHPVRAAPARGTPFSFCVTSETGGFGDDDINRRLFAQLTRYRPDLLLVVGDAVAHGSRYADWERYFFGPGRQFLARTPFYLCPGNHEENADWLLRFTAFPAPGTYYGFDYGNTHFTALDSTRLVDYVDGVPQPGPDLDPGADQRRFLRDDLAAAGDAAWRIAFFHYSPYVSGDYQVSQMRALCPDLEAGAVDLVFSSHTIVYERSHPLRGGRLDTAGGIVYIVAGGAGAKPDWLHPQRAWHTAQALATPHFVHVVIADDTLELQAVDVDGGVFDRMCLRR